MVFQDHHIGSFLVIIKIFGQQNHFQNNYNNGHVNMDQFMDYLQVQDQCMLFRMLIFFKKFILNNFHHFIHVLFQLSYVFRQVIKYIYLVQQEQDGVVNDMLLIQHFHQQNLNLCCL